MPFPAPEDLLTEMPLDADHGASRWLSQVDVLLGSPLPDLDRARLLEARAVVRANVARSTDDAHGTDVYLDAALAAELYEAVGRPLDAATCYATAACAAAQADRVSAALDIAVRSLVALRGVPEGERDPARAATMSNRLGVLCTQFLDYARAYDFYAEAARLTDQIGDRPRWSIAVHNAAEVLELRARLDGSALNEAERSSLLNTAEALARDLYTRGEPDALRLVDAPRLLAAVACERGAPEQALAWLTAAGDATGRPPRLGQSGAFLLGRGRSLVLLGRPAEALPDLTAAVAMLDPDWDVADYVLALQLRGRARRATGDREGALEDAERLAGHLWSRHRRYVSGFIDQVFSRAGAERERRQLQQHADQLSRTAEQDPLTGLDNRRAMERFLHERVREERVCLVMVDVDHFKEVNDQFGHAVGDEVLRRIASLLRNSVRGVDRVARWGGEEFLVALPGHGRALGLDAAERLRSVIVEQTWADLGPDVGITISAGVACGLAAAIDETLLRADAALYEAKRSGRNTVVGG